MLPARLHGLRGERSNVPRVARLFTERGLLNSGFKEELSAFDYKRRVEDGTIVVALARHEVHAGDVFYIPAGRVHAICSGVLLTEVQQSSDVTYRIYDYNRVGLDGRPRELHTELAAQALNYQVEEEYRSQGLRHAGVKSAYYY